MLRVRGRKNYPVEFKRECVRHYLSSELTQEQVAEKLGISKGSLYQWVKQYREDEGQDSDSSLTGEVRSELQRLREENRQLKMERDILKKATRFFANNP